MVSPGMYKIPFPYSFIFWTLAPFLHRSAALLASSFASSTISPEDKTLRDPRHRSLIHLVRSNQHGASATGLTLPSSLTVSVHLWNWESLTLASGHFWPRLRVKRTPRRRGRRVIMMSRMVTSDPGPLGVVTSHLCIYPASGQSTDVF